MSSQPAAVPAPSGEQFEIAAGDTRAVLVEVGGGVRVFEVAGRPVLAAYDVTAMRPKGAGSVLAPWPNRLARGHYQHSGVDYQLALTEPENGNAIHGLLRWERWQVAERSDDAITLHYDLPPQTGYPFPLEVSVRWSVGADGLRADHRVRNAAAVPVPFGLGVHPYVDLAGTPFTDLTVTVRGDRRLVLDDRSLPTGSTAVEDTEWDLRSTGSGPQPLGALRLDTAYTDLDRTDGIATVAVGRADGSVVEVWQDTAFGFVQVYTADAFDGSADALAVEPMTCAPDAFNNRAGLVVLQPDEVWSGSWGVRTR